VEILTELHALTGHGKYVFPGRSLSRPLSENGVLTALRAMGFSKEQMSGHGFRAAARTMLDELNRFAERPAPFVLSNIPN